MENMTRDIQQSDVFNLFGSTAVDENKTITTHVKSSLIDNEIVQTKEPRITNGR